jgi:SAM-dependent methyltransferase
MSECADDSAARACHILAPRPLARRAWDFLGIPFRLVLFDQAWLPSWGWTTLEEERLRAVLPFVRGRLLDVGAGANRLVRLHGDGVGVDIHDWGGGALVVDDSSRLPFEAASFDTITFIACLNHIPNREAALREARRLLRTGGRVIATMIDPILGGIGHAIWWYSEDKVRGGMVEGELPGMWSREVLRLCSEAGLRLALRRRFVYGLNNLFVFEIAEGTEETGARGDGS